MPTELQTDLFAAHRQQMVNEQLRARGVRDERVLAAMVKVPRHLFVDRQFQEQAYEDHPVPIGNGQTISQPLIVALMLEALSLAGPETALEIGTGSGYQTALLAELVSQVYSVERLPQLARSAAVRLKNLGYENASVSVGDGSLGLPDKAPFDAIVVAAAAPQVPAALLEQLREAGRLVVPVGPAYAQELQLIRRQQGQTVIINLEGCRFVPLIGQQGYEDGW